ncbi:MAG TPA: hypothetical protein DIW43_00895 [Spongiibacteraceae bacterium]|nr:hypothetical protein [Spongiibacteraceae bacterium]HCS25978.1 hypothetical protein [Spongiibacteraceae bacterium]
MQMRSRQTGLGMIQWAAIIGLGGLLGLCAFRLVPIYLDHMTIRQVVKNAANDPASRDMSAAEIRRSMQGAFLTNRIETIRLNDIKFTSDRSMIIMDASYEVRVPLIYNIDAVVKFEDLVYEIPRR